MSARKVVGAVMTAIPIVAIFVVAVVSLGWLGAFGVFAIAGAFLALLVGGLNLFYGDAS